MIACNIVGCSEPSKQSTSFQTHPDLPSAAPSNLLLQPVSATEMRITWAALSLEHWNDKLSNCLYAIHYESGSEMKSLLVEDIEANSTVVGGLTPNTVYNAHIVSRNSQGKRPGVVTKAKTFSSGILTGFKTSTST